MDKKIWTRYIVLLAVSALLVVFVTLRNRGYNEKTSDLVTVKTEAVTAFEVTKNPSTSSGQAKSLRIEKADSLWVFAAPDTGTVGQQKVDRFFKALDGQKNGFVTDKAEKYGHFNVDSTAVHVKLYSGDAVGTEFYIGRSGASYSSDYIRYPADPKVYMTSGKVLNTVSENAAFWR